MMMMMMMMMMMILLGNRQRSNDSRSGGKPGIVRFRGSPRKKRGEFSHNRGELSQKKRGEIEKYWIQVVAGAEMLHAPPASV